MQLLVMTACTHENFADCCLNLPYGKKNVLQAYCNSFVTVLMMVTVFTETFTKCLLLRLLQPLFFHR